MFDIYEHFSKLEEHKGAVVICQPDHLLITTESGKNSSGFRVPLPTRSGCFYLIRLKGRILDGSRAFIYCESALDGSRLLPREYFLESHEKEFLLYFQANYTLTYFGVLTTSADQFYRIRIDQCQVELVEHLSSLEDLSPYFDNEDEVELDNNIKIKSETIGAKNLIDLIDFTNEEQQLSNLVPPTIKSKIDAELSLMDLDLFTKSAKLNVLQNESPSDLEDDAPPSDLEVSSDLEVDEQESNFYESYEPESYEPESYEPELDEPELDEPELDEPELDEPELDEPELDFELSDQDISEDHSSYLDQLMETAGLSNDSETEPILDSNNDDDPDIHVLDENRCLEDYQIGNLIRRYRH